MSYYLYLYKYLLGLILSFLLEQAEKTERVLEYNENYSYLSAWRVTDKHGVSRSYEPFSTDEQ